MHIHSENGINRMLTRSGASSSKGGVGGEKEETMKVRTKSPETSGTDDGHYFQFQFEPCHIEKGKRGQKIFVCDICRGVFKRSFSLKRHYLRFHINYAFLSPRDLNNCAIVASNHRAVATQNGSSVSKKSNLLYRCHQCGFLVASKSELLRHLEKHPTTEASGEEYVNGVNRCPRCSTAFTLRKTLRRHIKKNRCRNPNPPKDVSEEKVKDESENNEQRQPEDDLSTSALDDAVDDLEEIDMEASLKLGCSTSLFRFACTICSRMFQTYVNMCRHRRLAHGRFGICSPNLLVSRNKSKPYLTLFKMVPAKNLLKDSSSNDSLKDFVEIADVNWRYFIDGKRPHLLSAKSPIPEEDPQLSSVQQEEEEQAIKEELEKRWTWGSTNYNINELMRLDVPVQQAFFQGLSRWKPDEEGNTADRTTSQSSDDTHISSILDLQPVKNSYERDAAVSDRERPEFNGDWTRPKSYLCFPCGQVFQDYYQLQEHQGTAHSFVLYRHIEFDETRKNVLTDIRNQVMRLFCKDRLNDQKALEPLESLSHQCTKCHATLSSIPDLHSHILQCSNHISSSPRKRRSRIMGNSRRNHWHSAAGERKRGMSTYSTTTSSYSKANNRPVRSRSPKDDPNSENGDSARRRSTRRILSFSETATNGILKNGTAKRSLRERPAVLSNSQAAASTKKDVQVDRNAKKKKLSSKEVLPEKRLTRAVVSDKPLPTMETCVWCKKRFQTRQSLTKHRLICTLKPTEQIVIVCDMAADDDRTQKRKSSGRSVEASTSMKAEQVTTKKKSEAPNDRGQRKRGVEALKEEIQSKAKAQTQASSSQVPPNKKKKTTAAAVTTPSTPVVKKSTPKSRNATPEASDSVRTRAALKQAQQSDKNVQSNQSQTSTPVVSGHTTPVTKLKTETAVRKRLSDAAVVSRASEASQSINGRLRSKSGTAVVTLKPMPILKPAPVVAAASAPLLDKKLPELKLGGVLTIKKAIGVAALKTPEDTRTSAASPKASTSASVAKKATVTKHKTKSATPTAGPSSAKRQNRSTEETHSKTSKRNHFESAPNKSSLAEASCSAEVEETVSSTRPIRSSRRSSSLSGDSLVNTDIEKSFLEALLPEQRIKIAEQTCPFCSKHYVYRNNFKKHLLEGCDTPDVDESTPSKSAAEEAKTQQIKNAERKAQSDCGNESKKKGAVTATKNSPKIKKKIPSPPPRGESNGQRTGPNVGHVAKQESNEITIAKNSASAPVSKAAKANHLGVEPIDPQLKSEVSRIDDNVPPVKEEQLEPIPSEFSPTNGDVVQNSSIAQTANVEASFEVESPDASVPIETNAAVARESAIGEVDQLNSFPTEACSNDVERRCHVVSSESDTNKDLGKEQPDTTEQKEDSQVEHDTPDTGDKREAVQASMDNSTNEVPVPSEEDIGERVSMDRKDSISIPEKSAEEDLAPAKADTVVCQHHLAPVSNDSIQLTIDEDNSQVQGIVKPRATEAAIECPGENGSQSAGIGPAVADENLKDEMDNSQASKVDVDLVHPISKQSGGEVESRTLSNESVERGNLAEVGESKEKTPEVSGNTEIVPPNTINEVQVPESSDNHIDVADDIATVSETRDTTVPVASENSENIQTISVEAEKEEYRVEEVASDSKEAEDVPKVAVDGKEQEQSSNEVDTCSNIRDEQTHDLETSNEGGDHHQEVDPVSTTAAALEGNGNMSVTAKCVEPEENKSKVEVEGKSDGAIQTADVVSEETTVDDATEVVMEIAHSEKKIMEDSRLSDFAPKIVEPLQKLGRVSSTDSTKSADTVSSSAADDSNSRSASKLKSSTNGHSMVNNADDELIKEELADSDNVVQSEKVDLNTHTDANSPGMLNEEEDRNVASDAIVSKKDVDLRPVTQVNLANICSQIAANICQYPTQS